MIYDKDKKCYIDKPNNNVSIGTKVPYFCRCYGEEGISIYFAGLKLFENISEHDECVKLRGYIEHFEYFAKSDRSMLDIYSEVFDRFFSYDNKYRKNVVNLLYNILLGHFVVTSYVFSSGQKETDKKIKKKASFGLRENNGISSDKFTYKLPNDETIRLCAKDGRFLDDVARILYYPQEPPFDAIRNPEEENERARTKKEITDNNHFPNYTGLQIDMVDDLY